MSEGLRSVSHSQIRLARQCMRRWFAEKILGKKPPITPERQARMDAGVAAHSHVEHYYQGVDPTPGSPAALVVEAARKHLPDRSDRVLVEREILLETWPGGPPFKGFLDWLGRGAAGGPIRETLPLLSDTKTTGNLKYARARHEITTASCPEGRQLLSYAHALFTGGVFRFREHEVPDSDARIHFQGDALRVRLVYIRLPLQRGRMQLETLAVEPDELVTREMAAAVYAGEVEVAREMDRWVRERPAGMLEVTPNFEACDDYGGCPHLATCGTVARKAWLSATPRAAVDEARWDAAEPIAASRLGRRSARSANMETVAMKPWLGLGFSKGMTGRGPKVTTVLDGCAKAAGVVTGDEILGIDGVVTPLTPAEILAKVKQAEVGDVISLVVGRAGAQLMLDVVLEGQPPAPVPTLVPAPAEAPGPWKVGDKGWWGMAGSPVTVQEIMADGKLKVLFELQKSVATVQPDTVRKVPPLPGEPPGGAHPAVPASINPPDAPADQYISAFKLDETVSFKGAEYKVIAIDGRMLGLLSGDTKVVVAAKDVTKVKVEEKPEKPEKPEKSKKAKKTEPTVASAYTNGAAAPASAEAATSAPTFTVPTSTDNLLKPLDLTPSDAKLIVRALCRYGEQLDKAVDAVVHFGPEFAEKLEKEQEATASLLGAIEARLGA